MAITRAQQAKQMLQNGGMLVQPGFGGKRQGYRGDDAYGGRASTSRSSSSSSSGGGKSSGGGGFSNKDDAREQESVTQTRTGTVKVGKTRTW